MIAIQSINRLEQIHKQGFIHRDIKPDNFLVGYGQNKDIIYLVDFGLSKKYIDSHYRNDKNLVGSLRYASIRNHKGIEQSRRDDLESLGYMIIYFINGCLPWQNVQKKTEKEIIEERRLSENPKTLEELSKKYKISRERVRQIETKAFEKLQKSMINSTKSKNLLPKN